MQTSRINMTSLLFATMSVCACFFLFESHAFAQVATAAKPNGSESRQYAGIHLLPVADIIVNRILKSPEVGGSASFEFLIEGDRSPDGVLSSVTITQTSGDPKLKQAIADMVAALSESHLLRLLSEAGHLRLKLGSNSADVSGSASYRSVSAEHAAMMAHGYDAMIYSYGLGARDYAPVYKALKAKADGDEMTIAFAMSRETFCALLSKYLSSN